MASLPVQMTDEEFHGAICKVVDKFKHWGGEIALEQSDRMRFRTTAFNGRYQRGINADTLFSSMSQKEKVTVWVSKQTKRGEVLLIVPGQDKVKRRIKLYGKAPVPRKPKAPPPTRFDREVL